MKVRLKKSHVCVVLLLFALLGGGMGCATTDTENLSERPWNTPKRWEHGLPPSMMEGR
jgi:hypothetical protein